MESNFDQIAVDKASSAKKTKEWTTRIEALGPWSPEKEPLALTSTNSLPMPVEIGSREDFEPFFTHLKANGTHEHDHLAAQSSEDTSTITAAVSGKESTHYPVPLLEFPRGVLYKDHRMDLCKMVVGPDHIDELLDSLENNSFVKHFLLGNNIIGPHGARRIAQFVTKFPDQMDTWYLAGNCIDCDSFATLTKALVNSTSLTNLWLKRNPLGASCARWVSELIKRTPNLRTLDLDQTSLGDAGAAMLFDSLAQHKIWIPLRNLYLNANGISTFGTSQLARYLASPHCQLESLYLSTNPLGNPGIAALAPALSHNRSLIRLTLSSVGMSDDGASQLFRALKSHPRITTLIAGTAYQTDDLGARYNYLSDDAAPAIVDFITHSRDTLRYLDLGYTAMSCTAFNAILCAIAGIDFATMNAVHSSVTIQTGPLAPSRLLWFMGKPGSQDNEISNIGLAAKARIKANTMRPRLKKLVHERLNANIQAEYGPDMTFDRFEREEKRFLVSSRDVRLIDSVYRNRDAGLARRGLKSLQKHWDEGDRTLERVMVA